MSEYDITNESYITSIWVRATQEAEDRMLWEPERYTEASTTAGAINKIIYDIAVEFIGKEDEE